MIFNLLFNLLILIIGGISSFLPVVTIADIPYLGNLIREALITIVQLWNALLTTFPYAKVPWDVFLYVIIPFEALMLISKLFFGSRHPTNN